MLHSCVRVANPRTAVEGFTNEGNHALGECEDWMTLLEWMEVAAGLAKIPCWRWLLFANLSSREFSMAVFRRRLSADATIGPRGHLALGCFLAVSCCTAVVIMTFAESARAFEENTPSSPVDFNRDIRPILSNHCFQCHGADESSRASELRLDSRESAVERGAINPAALADSHLLGRITSTNSEERMPPAEANKPLNDRQIQLLQQWIAEGAPYEDHWAFRPVQKPAVPSSPDATWSRNEIDAFVLARLDQARLKPSPAADRATLIRRAYQDVTGLLPSWQEVKAFENDTAADAWNTVIDRLLQSPHYGERWGRHWLDQARYADSNGYTIDGPRIMWPYRDWVIAALNNDMPFDQFTIEQLAGDLLPNASKSQRVASAFHRNTMINEEGGVKPDQYRHEALIDRVSTTGAVWLGLTVGCAQCHSHKFDPISHDEFYRMYAFFNGASDANNAGETVDVLSEEMFGWSETQRNQLVELQELRKEKSDLELNSPDQPALSSLEWHWQPAKVTAVRASGSSILKINEDSSLLVKPLADANDSLSLTFQKPESLRPNEAVTAIRLRTMTHPDLPAGGPGTASNGNFVLTDIALKAGSMEKRFVRAWADHSQPDYSVTAAIDELASTGWAINVNPQQAASGFAMNAAHQAIFVMENSVAFADDSLTVVMRHDLSKNYLVGHFAIDFSTASPVMDAVGSRVSVRLAEIKNRINELETALPAKGASVRQMVMKELADAPQTFVLKRGDFLQPDHEHGPLAPGVPAAINRESDPAAFTNRLDLAHWLVSPHNPLTARVTVNRVWAKYFGRGLVETENDFGYQSTPPTHPELLDWLAADFMEHGWSLKHLHRTILNSAAYRQSSVVQTPDEHLRSTETDPDNYLLARQTRFRVEAEIVRDLALVASGLFAPKLGGPGIYLPQPDGIYDFTQNKKDWPTATGSDRYRRTMYTMFYRSAPYPLLSTFDAPDFSVVCTRRVRSNTPLQSLTVANDLVFTELAEGLAARVVADTEFQNDEDRCRAMFRYSLTRTPDAQELDVLLNFFSRELSRFQSEPQAAAEFVKHPVDGHSVETLAAWTSVARALLNTDEFVMRN